MLKVITDVGFNEDLWACKNRLELLDTDKIEFDEMMIAGDKSGLLFRKLCYIGITRNMGLVPQNRRLI